MTLIGVDCAVNPKDIGIAEASLEAGTVVVRRIVVASPDPVEELAAIVSANQRALLALDSPLGWPASLGRALYQHQAGHLIDEIPNQLFRRETDRCVRRLVGKQPLEVGADRIARTAVASLKLIHDLTARLGSKLPLVWDPDDVSPYGCVEVYPAATLEALGLSSRGYKGKKSANQEARSKLVENLAGEVSLSDSAAAVAQATDHGLDAAICCLSAADFLRRRTLAPHDYSLARKEGWIWVRTPTANHSVEKIG